MNKKTFAFKVAAQKAAKKNSNEKRWQAREGLAAAGCTDPTHLGDYRYDSPRGGWDNGEYC